jgi:FeS assembly protein SufD
MSRQQHQELRTLPKESVESLSSELKEPSWLTKFRLDALEQFNKLPEEQSNLYTKYSPTFEIDLFSLSRYEKAKPDPKASSLEVVTEGMESGYYYISTQTETIASKNIQELQNKKVIFCDLHEALEKHSDVLRNIFAQKAIKPSDDKYAALNSAFFSSAWLVVCPKDTVLDSALRVRFYLNSTKPHLQQFWIVAESGSQINVLTETYGAEVKGTLSEVVEAYVGDDASANYSNIQNVSHDTVILSNKKAVCKRDATMTWTLGNFGGSTVRSRLESSFASSGASAEVVEVVFGDANQKFDLVSDLTHLAPNTRGRILSNAVLKESARSIFKGMIRISKEAKNASAYLAGHGILLSPNARSDAIPGLEISTNEVKATHSASVAQIDEEQVFYMMTRGVPEDEAKKFIVLGFLEPGISRIRSEELKDTMRDLIEAKWYGKRGLIRSTKKEVLFEEEKKEPQQPRDIFEGHYKYR